MKTLERAAGERGRIGGRALWLLLPLPGFGEDSLTMIYYYNCKTS